MLIHYIAEILVVFSSLLSQFALAFYQSWAFKYKSCNAHIKDPVEIQTGLYLDVNISDFCVQV
jgi:hypothetical protein